MNVKPVSSFTHTIILCLLIQVHFCLLYVPYNGYEFRDLNSTGICWSSQVGTWAASALRTTQMVTVCNSEYLLGGYDILKNPNDYFYKTYTGLPTHSMIYFTMTVYLIDSWDAGDKFIIDFDGYQLLGPVQNSGVSLGKLCGNFNWIDGGYLRVFGKVPHSSLTLTLRMIHGLDSPSYDESFGFRNVNLLFTNSPDTTYPASGIGSICALARNSFALNNVNCPCAEGQFQYTSSSTCANCHPACSSCWAPGPNNCYQCAPGASFVNGQCIYCDPSCQVCSGPGPAQCTTCQPGLYLYNGMCTAECALPATSSTDGCVNSCTSPCPISTQFLYWDGSCQSTCLYPLHQIITSEGIRKCVYPCGTGEYLYWDDSCEKSCPSPLNPITSIGKQFCSFPCASNMFLYWNTSCFATCDPPLVQYFDKDREFCRYECSSSEYLNFDGSCVASCDSPLIGNTLNGLKYCQLPCPDSSYFLYWNNTCQTSCFPPLQTYERGNLNYCAPSCEDDQFLLWNGTCIDSCPLPATMQSSYSGIMCILPCSDPLDYYYEETQSCSSVCHSHSVEKHDLYFKCLPTPTVTEFGSVVGLLLESSASPGMVTFLTVAKLTQPIRYLSMAFPSRLETLVLNKGRKLLSLELGFKMPSKVQEHFPLQTLASVFEDQGLHSSFLVNIWQDLSSIWIAIGLLILVFFVKLLSKIFQWKFAEFLCDSFDFIVRWNFILILLAIDIDDIALFASLEFRTFRGGSVAAIWSLAICILMIIVMSGYMLFTFCLATRAQDLKNNKNSTTTERQSFHNFLSRWEGYQVLFRGYKNGKHFTHLFYFFYMIRLATPMVIAAAYYTLPMMQATAYFFISCVTVSYIAYAQPIKTKVNQIQVLTIESFVLVNYFGIFLLAIFDQTGIEASLASVIIGDMIILANLSINLLLVAFLLVKIGLQIKVITDLGKKKAIKQKSAYFQLVFLLIQQCGMGFEKAKSINLPNVVRQEQSSLLMKLQKMGLKNNNNNTSLASERISLADSTIAGSTSRDTNGFAQRKASGGGVDMNEEIVTFIDPNAVAMNTSQISFVGLGGGNGENETASDAFPITRIVDKSMATGMGFEMQPQSASNNNKRRIYPELSLNDTHY